MFSSVGAGNSTARTSNNPAGQSQIAMLLKQIKGLHKKITDLQRQLMNETDPVARMALMKEIQNLEDMVRLFEAQIAQLNANQKSKQANLARKDDDKRDQRHAAEQK
jgi:predicted  nucleic acid-binding Zn-ribbon protein